MSAGEAELASRLAQQRAEADLMVANRELREQQYAAQRAKDLDQALLREAELSR